MRSQSLLMLAPAKVNLSLAVLGRRPDGFHDIESWAVALDWHDRISLSAAGELSLEVSGRADGVPNDSSNLAWQAATAFAAASGREPDVHIVIEKRIPTGAGLGGGSSDAAATLLGLNRLWDLAWPTDRLASLAAELGSDVPLFLGPTPAVIRGRGERIERVPAAWPGEGVGWMVLVLPPFGVSTAEVYRAWSDRPQPGDRVSLPWANAPENSVALMSGLFNDLEQAAFAVEPRLARLHALIDEPGVRPVRLTGSGSALFTIFDDEAGANFWRNKIEARTDLDWDIETFVVSTQTIRSEIAAKHGSAEV